MPPKVKITKEDIVVTAVDIVRRNGAAALNARNIAAELHCSTQPLFTNFSTMEELKLAVVAAADQCYQEYTEREMMDRKYPPYKASGMAYIRFAREERELFKLLFMRDRTEEPVVQDTEVTDRVIDILQKNTGLSREEASLFHLEMWAYVHGIAAMIATGFLELDEELISRMLTDSYQGLKKQYESREG